MENNEKEFIRQLIAKDLLEVKAVFLRPSQPFVWASGIKVRFIATIVLRLLRLNNAATWKIP